MAVCAAIARPWKGVEMDMLLDLWLPIVISTVACFVASSIIWMALPHHKADMKALPEEGVMDRALGEMKLEPGGYYIPNCSDKEKFKGDEFKARWNNGPWAFLQIPAGRPSFAKNLAVTLVEFLVIAIFIGYLAGASIPAGAEYLHVFQIVGTAGVLAHVLGTIHHEFFQMKTVRHVAFCMFDGVVYALITAGIFAAFWPEGAEILNNAAGSLPTP
jgi:hypothetical protein